MNYKKKETVKLSKKAQAKKAAEAKNKPAAAKPKKEAVKKDTSQLLGIEAKKDSNFSEWYTQVITRAELLDYYDVSGCYILRPNAYALWEGVQSFLDARFKAIGTQNCYFPMFVSQAALKKEEDELHGFEAEVAWVTKSGKSDLQIPIAVRPTSETVIYPTFKNWIKSHRDLPIRINQWCNVVRWEFKHPVPFIRTREFLWQEGHTAHDSLENAEKEVYYILDTYADCYEKLLAVPVIKGKKSEKEKFAGALFTTTIEAFIPTNGRAVQAATSHCLGQTFAKIFDIEYQNDDGSKSKPWQNSWGLTTRSIGVMIMVHGDDKGLVLPPRVAPNQVVIVPICMKNSNVEELNAQANKLGDDLKAKGIRVLVDTSDAKNPGWKFNHYEKMGIPIRIELGPKDMEKHSVVVVRRDTCSKQPVAWDVLAHTCSKLLEEIQESMFQRAKEQRDKAIVDVKTWKDFVPALSKKCICRVPWCNCTTCEEDIKARSAAESAVSSSDEEQGLSGAAKSLCMPLEQPKLEEGTVCFACGKPATVTALFGRSY